MVYDQLTATKRLTKQTQRRLSRLRKPTSKELDLLLLAGCSCLMTLLYHPVAEALQTSPGMNSGSPAIATSTTIPTTSMNTFHLIPTSSREERVETEELTKPLEV
jgi:hypothetical protein